MLLMKFLPDAKNVKFGMFYRDPECQILWSYIFGQKYIVQLPNLHVHAYQKDRGCNVTAVPPELMGFLLQQTHLAFCFQFRHWRAAIYVTESLTRDRTHGRQDFTSTTMCVVLSKKHVWSNKDKERCLWKFTAAVSSEQRGNVAEILK